MASCQRRCSVSTDVPQPLAVRRLRLPAAKWHLRAKLRGSGYDRVQAIGSTFAANVGRDVKGNRKGPAPHYDVQPASLQSENVDVPPPTRSRSMPVRVDVTNLGRLTRSLQRKPASRLLTADCWPRRRRRRGVWATTSVSVEAALLLLTTSEVRVDRFLAERGDGSAPPPYERHRRSGSTATGERFSRSSSRGKACRSTICLPRGRRLFVPSHCQHHSVNQPGWCVLVTLGDH